MNLLCFISAILGGFCGYFIFDYLIKPILLKISDKTYQKEATMKNIDKIKKVRGEE